MKEYNRRDFIKTAGIGFAGLAGSLVFPGYVFGKTPDISMERYNTLPKNKKWLTTARILNKLHTLEGKFPSTKTISKMFDKLSKGHYSANSSKLNKKEIPALIDEYSYPLSTNTIITTDLLLALIEQESTRTPNCVGDVGEGGLMQIKPRTWAGNTEGNFYTNVFIPEENIYTGTKFFNWLEEYCSDEKTGHPEWRDLDTKSKQATLLAAYNCGGARLKSVNWHIVNTPKSTRDYLEKNIEKLI